MSGKRKEGWEQLVRLSTLIVDSVILRVFRDVTKICELIVALAYLSIKFLLFMCFLELILLFSLQK